MMRDLGESVKVVLGVQVIEGLDSGQKKELFGEGIFYGIQGLESVLRASLPPQTEVEAASVYSLIPEDRMRAYLDSSREISFYLSQGCVYRCTFCAADKNQSESYRNMGVVEADLAHLMDEAIRLGQNSLAMYLSNLDVFQTPDRLAEFARIVIRLRGERPGFETKIRGLATAHMFLEAKKRGDSLELMKEAGLWTLGIGVDGASADVWRASKKNHNTVDKCRDALELCDQNGIIPEAFMVIGHPGETSDSLRKGIEFLRTGQGRIPQLVARPYVAKACVPGNGGWTMPEYEPLRRALLKGPDLFQALDYAAYPSRLTHPDEEIRAQIREIFDEMCALPNPSTVPVEPIELGMSQEEIARIKELNVGRYDR
jgi:Radical SAM superfamily